MNFEQLCKKTGISPKGNFTYLLVALDKEKLSKRNHNKVIEEMKIAIGVEYSDNQGLKKHMIDVADCKKKRTKPPITSKKTK